jgi:RNA polymerase sigma factor (sigma-70 family)
MEDWRLLRDYAENGSEASFTALVNRHLGLVYSAALRRLGDPQAAEEVAQTVFCLLARKARGLRSETALVGWLYRTVCFEAAKYWRTECRRRRREQEAARMKSENSDQDETWEQLAPHLDEVMGQISERDRLALLLRFFQGKAFPEVGQTLGITEDAARMRVNRALEELRLRLNRKKVACSAAALGALLLDNATVPVSAANSIRAAALQAAQAASVPSFLMTLLALMAKAKLKTAVAAGFTLLMTFTVGLYLYNEATESALPSVLNSNPEPSSATVQEPAAFGLQRRAAFDAQRRLPSVPATQGDATQALTAREFYERGLKADREKRYDDALADFTKAIELDPGFTAAYFSRAGIYDARDDMERRDYAKAVADYTRQLEIEPRDCSARHNRALACEQLRQYDKAIADYTEIIQGDTDFSRLVDGKDKQVALDHHYRGRVYFDKKDYANAIADFTEAVRLDPDIAKPEAGGRIILRRGQAYQALKEYEKAQADFIRYLEIDPDYFELWESWERLPPGFGPQRAENKP